MVPDEQGGNAVATQAARVFGRRDVAALGTVAVLVLLNQIVIQPTQLRLLLDASVINVAGRQRMLSQSLSKAILALAAADTIESRAALATRSGAVLDRWSDSHARLRPSESALGRNALEPSVRAEFEGLEPSFTRLRTSALRAMNADDGDPAARRRRRRRSPERRSGIPAEDGARRRRVRARGPRGSTV